jgi:hypothetical protein
MRLLMLGLDNAGKTSKPLPLSLSFFLSMLFISLSFSLLIHIFSPQISCFEANQWRRCVFNFSNFGLQHKNIGTRRVITFSLSLLSLSLLSLSLFLSFSLFLSLSLFLSFSLSLLLSFALALFLAFSLSLFLSFTLSLFLSFSLSLHRSSSLSCLNRQQTKV